MLFDSDSNEIYLGIAGGNGFLGLYAKYTIYEISLFRKKRRYTNVSLLVS